MNKDTLLPKTKTYFQTGCFKQLFLLFFLELIMIMLYCLLEFNLHVLLVYFYSIQFRC